MVFPLSGGAFEFVAEADITGLPIAKDKCQILAIPGEIATADLDLLIPGFAAGLGLEIDAGG